MARASRLSVYVTVYLSLCLLANLALVAVFLGGGASRRPAPAPPPAAWSPSSGHPLGCAEIPSIANLTLIGTGWTKAVYKGWYSGSWLAVKTVHTSGHDMSECEDAVSTCYRHCAAKITREAHVLHQLSHDNVIKVFGKCVPDVDYSPGPPQSGVMAVVVELGRPVRVVEVLQMDYETRLQLASDVGNILRYLSCSPLGTLLMKDFRREQFVIIDGSLKLSDVDDVVVGDPPCTRDQQCAIRDGVMDTILVNITCEGGSCRGFNSVLNAIHASQHFMRILIPYGGPAALEKVSLNIVEQQSKGKLDSENLHQEIQSLVKNYATGAYLTENEKREIQNYIVYHGSTVRGEDFSCLRTVSSGCVHSVSSPAEGAWLCSQLSECVAFILLDQWTWTGRQVAVFKAGTKEVQEDGRHTLYTKRGQG